MKTPAPADLHRWSEELARNPASLAFLPLARAYRRLSRRDLALQLCLRGLEHHPTHVEAHALLALLYFEAGERAKAADEWATVLRLKPGNFEALRGMGFRYLEQGDIAKARHHLERAALIRPDDATVQEALRLIRQREAAITTRPAQVPVVEFEPWMPVQAPPASQAEPQPHPQPAPVQRQATATRPAEPRFMDASAPKAAPAATPASPGALPSRPAAAAAQSQTPMSARPAARAAEPPRTAAGPPPDTARPPAGPQRADRVPVPARGPSPAERPPAALGDPVRVFETMKGGPLLGVLLLDRRGLVLAGTLGPAAGNADELGAILGGAIDEAVRTATHLSLGSWRGLLLECESATLQVAPIGTEALVVVAAQRDAPAGWLLRTAAHATSLAERFVGVLS